MAARDTVALLRDVLAEQQEGGLQSRTAVALRAQLGDSPRFQNLSDEDWVKFGQRVKKMRGTSSAFTGVLAALLKYLQKNPKGLPVTAAFAEKTMIRSDELRLSNPTGERVLGLLEKDGLLEGESTTATEALKANHAAADEQLAKSDPNAEVTVWFPSDDLRDLLKFLNRMKVSIRAEAVTNIRPSLEMQRLVEVFGWRNSF